MLNFPVLTMLNRWIVAALLTCVVASAHQIEVTGRILDSRGNPLPVAHAELRRAGRLEPLVQVRANPDGSFALRADGEGLFLVRLVGLHHQPVDIPLLVENAPAQCRITVQLPTLPFPAVRDSVLLASSRALPTSRQGVALVERKGVYTLPKGAATMQRYRIMICGGGRCVVTASQRDSLVLEPDGYYSAVARDSTIEFDPAELPRRNDAERIECQPVQWQEVAEAYRALDRYRQVYVDSSNAMMERASRSGQFSFDLAQLEAAVGASRWRDTVEARLRQVRSELAEQVWLLFAAVLPPQGNDDPLLRRLLQRVPPSSPLWALDVQALYRALASRPEEVRRQFIDELIERNPDTTARAQVAFTELVSAYNARDRERARRLYAALTERCPTHPLATAARRYNPDRNIQVGSPLPAFRLQSARNTTVTPQQFKGSPLLIAVVMANCPACVERLEELARWLDTQQRKLNVLAITVGAKPDERLAAVLDRVRATRVQVESFTAPELAPFEVEGFPTLILADSDGKICATNDQLRNLERDVEFYLQAQR